jgi:ABC-2 type transport system ATP-binding protein
MGARPAGEPLIIADNLTKTFRVAAKKDGPLGGLRTLFSRDVNEVRAVAGISFAIAPGELVGYLGPNGSGKSTTIKMLTGILHPSGGHVTVGGLVPHRDRLRYSQRIGVVFGQRSQLVYDLPPRDTFALLRRMYAVPPRRHAENLAEFAALLDLGAILDRPVRLLSLGERMRCELVAALLHEPPLLFLDEPTIGLDAEAQERVRAFIRRINRERGTTILLTTHDLVDIEQLCRRVIVIDRGALVYDGALATLRGRYGHERTLTFSLLDDAPLPTTDALAAELATLGADIAVEQREGRAFAVRFDPRAVAAATLTRHLVNRHPIADLAVAEADLAMIIRALYAAGSEGGR